MWLKLFKRNTTCSHSLAHKHNAVWGGRLSRRPCVCHDSFVCDIAHSMWHDSSTCDLTHLHISRDSPTLTLTHICHRCCAREQALSMDVCAAWRIYMWPDSSTVRWLIDIYHMPHPYSLTHTYPTGAARGSRLSQCSFWVHGNRINAYISKGVSHELHTYTKVPRTQYLNVSNSSVCSWRTLFQKLESLGYIFPMRVSYLFLKVSHKLNAWMEYTGVSGGLFSKDTSHELHV